MLKCPLTARDCESGTECRLKITLEDFTGCPFDLAQKAIQHLKVNTLLPAALKFDEIVKRVLGGGNN